MPFKSIEKRRQWQRDRRARRVEYMNDKHCQDCGATENLDLHHLDKSTKIDSWIWLWGEKRIKEELAKCIILCHSCHTKRHHRENGRDGLPKHGTTSTYVHHKCRCLDCVEAAKQYRKNKRN